MKLPKAIVNNPMVMTPKRAIATPADPAAMADIGALVSARTLAERQARHDAEVAANHRKAKAAAKISRRDDRVQVTRTDDSRRIAIAPKFLSDMLADQFAWGFCFAFVNPGVFIMAALAGILYALGVTSGGLLAGGSLVLWMLLLTACNVVYALATRRRLTLALTNKGYYSLYEKKPKRPVMFGPVHELEVKVDKPNAARLGEVRFEDKHSQIEVDGLSPCDLDLLRQTFPQ